MFPFSFGYSQIGRSPEYTTPTCVPTRCAFHDVRVGARYRLYGGYSITKGRQSSSCHFSRKRESTHLDRSCSFAITSPCANG